MKRDPVLIVPVESQVRELDAKLLLAAMAAERGFSVIIGSRAYVHFAAGSLPRGIYVAKSMRAMSASMFQILADLGHTIVAWEEEALVHPPAEIFYPLRMSPETVSRISHLFCWGEEYRNLVAEYPPLTKKTRLHVTGNPRGDMLRPELRSYFDPEVSELRGRYGDFLLINTNFTDVNPFIPSIGLFQSGRPSGPLGQAGKGMSLDFARGLYDHKASIMQSFEALVPHLARAFPGMQLVIRPHPSEDHAPYLRLAADFGNVHVCNSGNVVPWLLACRALIHNGCTTAVEASVLGVPALAYLPVKNTLYDYDFQGLPNRLSAECGSPEELVERLHLVLGDRHCRALDAKQAQLLRHHLCATEGRLACDRILDVLQQTDGSPCPRPTTRLLAKSQSHIKAVATRAYMHRPGRNRQDYHDHRFPPIAVNQVRRRIRNLGLTLSRFDNVRVSVHSHHLFHVSHESINR